MDLIADGLFIATALTAALYCFVLSRRLRRLSDAETGIGVQIHALNKALEETRAGLAETRRGVAEARASVRNASEALGVEVEAARRETQMLTAARTAALDALAMVDQAKARPAPTSAPAPAPARELAPTPAPPAAKAAASAEVPEDDGEDIPDWPDGVIDPFDEDDADAEFAAAEAEEGSAAMPEVDAPVGGAEPPRAAEPEPAAFSAPAATAAAGDASEPLRIERLAL
ncbi:MAG: hypothetical protein AAGC57_15765 [Pseudomonadota bacterium]